MADKVNNAKEQEAEKIRRLMEEFDSETFLDEAGDFKYTNPDVKTVIQRDDINHLGSTSKNQNQEHQELVNDCNTAVAERTMLMGDKHRKFNNVYIKNFGEELDDDKLRDMFEEHGKITSAKVMYDVNGKSRGFGFVSFEEDEAAEKADAALNGTEMGGKQLYCGRAQKKAERQAELKEKFEKIKLERINRYQGVNLYVKNLDDGVDDERLRKEFSQFGTITSAKVMGEGGRSRGFGFVCFSSPEEATKAVTEMNGRIIGAKPLYVALAQRKEERRTHLASQHIQKLASMCQQVMYDVNGKSRGFGFVSFEEDEAAEKADAALNGTEMGGKQLYCGRAQKKAERQAELKEKFEKIKLERINRYQGVNLYVKNLDDGVDDERLRKEFSQFGTITSAKVMGEGGRSRGFGFVCFSSPEEATKAVTEMNGRIIGAKPLYVALAQRKEERRTHLASQHIQKLASMCQQNFQYNPVFYPGGAGYFVPIPTMPKAQRGFFTPANIPSIRQARALWASGVRPNQAAGFQAMLNQKYTCPLPAQAQMQPTTVNTHPITGQPVAAAASCGVAVAAMTRPQGAAAMAQPEARPAAYTAGAQQMPGQPDYPMQQTQQSVIIPGQDPLTASMLAAAPPQEQKQMLGERLFPLIQSMYPELIEKITAILQEIDISELLHMLELQESLKLNSFPDAGLGWPLSKEIRHQHSTDMESSR